MYNIPYFKENDPERLKAFIKAHPFAILIGCDNLEPVATQVPLLIEEDKKYFTGHIMKGTDHHKAFLNNPNVLCVFTGAHTYVSASWYENPQTASTWNYMSVHAKGTLEFLNDEALIEVLQKTTAQFENNEHSPASFHNLPPDYVQKLMKAIVAVRIHITSLEGVFKLSQNRDKESYHTIIKKLNEQPGDAQRIAKEMQIRASELF